MKCLVYCPVEHSEWMKDFFPNIHPYFLKILNKPLLEYYIDFCVLNKISEIRVVKSSTSKEMENYFRDGMQWGLDISYNLARPGDSLSKIILKNSSFCKDSDLLIIHGLCFLNFKKDNNINFFAKQDENRKVHSANSAVYFFKKTKNPADIDLIKIIEDANAEFSITLLNGIKSYYDLSTDIFMNRPDDYFLPGYNNEPGVYIGRNVIYNPNSVTLKKPIMIGDNVQIRDNTLIGPNSVLGNNIIIDSSSTIIKSIIYEQSYIGSDLEVNEKIVFKNHLINPFTGDSIEIVDKFFVSSIEKNIISRSVRKMAHGFFALILIILYFLPYLFFLIFGRSKYIKPERKECYISKDKKLKKLLHWKILRSTFKSRMFIRFSMDKYPLYFEVLTGNLLLAGNCILPKNPSSSKLISKMPVYFPGVFDFPGMLLSCPDDDEFEIHEIYYIHNTNFKMNLRIIKRTLLGRLFSARRWIKNEL
ncbi:MAG: hypothetical protein K8R49_01825 [Candidatus Cloacimonetes bacterium]|nr:hypothetical protein [Candidatus Cloacimonadota bacterium]